MPKPKNIPFSTMQKISGSGVFVKRFGYVERSAMKPYAHRDDYYMVVLLTGGSAAIEIDFERKELKAGSIFVVSPWQVHNKPTGEEWNADGWLLAFSPEILSESDTRAIDEYSISPRPFSLHRNTMEDICALCSIMERNRENDRVSKALASAVKSMVVSTLSVSGNEICGRYRMLTSKLRNLLDAHMPEEKRPGAYASMLNISEVYLNEAVKGATGLSASAYIRSRVIIQAKRQLVYTSLSAKEIAYTLGYEDYAYFSKLFKKGAGMSPVEYRKNLK